MTKKITHISRLIFLIIVFVSCKETNQYDTLYPEEYFPAYPGSYWVYNNGTTKTTDAYYRVHNVNGTEMYVAEYDGKTVMKYIVGGKEIINFEGAPWLVNKFDGMDVYREIINMDTTLFITQYPYNDSLICDTSFVEVIPNDTFQYLSEVTTCDGYEFCDTLLLNCINDTCDTVFYAFFEEIILRDTIIIDTLISNCDSITTYSSVIVVKEFVASLDEIDCWFYKDYYAKDIGLVKREVASCSDSTAFITEFELVKYHVNK